jgi:DNA-binding response OmpR family regulator
MVSTDFDAPFSISGLAIPSISPQVESSLTAPFVQQMRIALIAPEERRRDSICAALSQCHVENIHKFFYYPDRSPEIARMLNAHYDVLAIDLDGDPEHALRLIQSVSSRGPVAVAAFSSRPSPELAMRSLNAGAREFLQAPFARRNVEEALQRIATRPAPPLPAPRPRGSAVMAPKIPPQPQGRKQFAFQGWRPLFKAGMSVLF